MMKKLFLALGLAFSLAACGGVEGDLEGDIQGDDTFVIETTTSEEGLYGKGTTMTCEPAPTVCSLSNNCYWCDFGLGGRCMCFSEPLTR